MLGSRDRVWRGGERVSRIQERAQEGTGKESNTNNGKSVILMI